MLYELQFRKQGTKRKENEFRNCIFVIILETYLSAKLTYLIDLSPWLFCAARSCLGLCLSFLSFFSLSSHLPLLSSVCLVPLQFVFQPRPQRTPNLGHCLPRLPALIKRAREQKPIKVYKFTSDTHTHM